MELSGTLYSSSAAEQISIAVCLKAPHFFSFITTGIYYSDTHLLAKRCFYSIYKHFSNYGLRITSGPRDLPLWSFKKYRRKMKIQMICILHYRWKSQSLEMTHGNCLSLFSQYWHFMKFITLPVNWLPLHSHKEKRDLKHYECGVSRHLFSVHLAPCLLPSQGPPKFITEDQSTSPFYVFTTFIIVLLISSCTFKWSITVHHTPIIEHAKMHISILVLKYAIKF